MMKQFKIKAFRTTKISILGISSAEKAYKLCWQMNEHFQFHFKNVEQHEVVLKNQAVVSFLLFADEEHYEECTLYLISNNSDGHYLSDQYKIADYFFILQGDISKEERELFKQKVEQLDDVQLVIPVDVDTLKNKAHFIIEE